MVRVLVHICIKLLDTLGINTGGLFWSDISESQTKLICVKNGIKEFQRANAWFILDRILKFATAFKFRLKLELEVLYFEKNSEDIMSPNLF